MDEATRRTLADAMGIGEDERLLCETAGNHDYDCRCGTCQEWWKGVGPNPDSGMYGPFTIEEIEGQSQSCLCGRPATRLLLEEPQTEDAEPIRVYHCDQCWVDL